MKNELPQQMRLLGEKEKTHLIQAKETLQNAFLSEIPKWFSYQILRFPVSHLQRFSFHREVGKLRENEHPHMCPHLLPP